MHQQLINEIAYQLTALFVLEHLVLFDAGGYLRISKGVPRNNRKAGNIDWQSLTTAYGMIISRPLLSASGSVFKQCQKLLQLHCVAAKDWCLKMQTTRSVKV